MPLLTWEASPVQAPELKFLPILVWSLPDLVDLIDLPYIGGGFDHLGPQSVNITKSLYHQQVFPSIKVWEPFLEGK